MIRLPIPFVGAAIGLIAIGAAAAATEPARSSTSLPVVAGGAPGGVLRASVVCPDLRIVPPDTLTTTVAAGTASPGAGSVTMTSATGQALKDVPILKAAQPRGLYGGPVTGPIELQAQGPLANALVAEQVSRGNKTADRGWSEARCEPPRAEQWFVGPATTPGNTPVLELANPTDVLAVVDVTVYTPDGVSRTNAAHNLSLAPHSVLNLKLTDLAPNDAVTAVRVTTRSGRVSAAVLDTRTSGQNLNGTDWVPVTSPGTRQTITGIPAVVAGAAPVRSLIVGVPGYVDARVQIQVIGPTGTFVPVGLESILIQAGTVKAIDLSPALGANTAGVIVTSSSADVPIVSTVFVDVPSTKNPTIREITYLGPNLPLQGAAMVPLVYTAGDVDSVLVLSAQGRVATATLVLTDSAGVSQQRRLTIQPDTTLAVSLRDAGAPDNSSATVIPDPGSPPIYATRLIEENGALGPLISSFALIGAPAQQQIPPVVAEPLS